MKAVWGTLIWLLGLSAVLTGGPVSPAEAANRPFTVAAASYLSFAFTELGEIFEQETGRRVVFSLGSTGHLATQIEHGAPFDLFAAANVAYVDRLIGLGALIPETRALYATGRIALATHTQNRVDVANVRDLLDPGVRFVAIANPNHAPYGQAAKEALISAGIWDDIQSKLVLAENIRQTLQFVQTGNADAGIIAASIADVPELRYHLIDEAMHNPLEHALAVVAGSPHEETARAFAAFVGSPTGGAVMERYGFALPQATSP